MGSKLVVGFISVLVVDDFAPWRQSIRSMLQGHAGLQLVDEVSDGLEAVRRASELKPDLILLDIGLPSLNGIEAAKRIHQIVPVAKIVFLTMNNDADVVEAALSNGAKGYVLKSHAGSELLPAIAAVFRGDQFVSSGLASNLDSSRPLN